MLEPADFVAGFPALIPLLREAFGDIFHYATLYTVLDQPIAVSSESFEPVPTRDVVTPDWPVRLIVTTTEPCAFLWPPRAASYNYTINHRGIAIWSAVRFREPITIWIWSLKEKKAMARAKVRMAPIKEELIAAAWAPERVERLLATGGMEALD